MARKAKSKSTSKTSKKKPAKKKGTTKRAARAKKTATKRAKAPVKVNEMSLSDIKSLERELQKAKAQAKDRERKVLKEKIDKILEGTGFSIFEIYGIAPKKRGKTVGIARYANPDDPSDTWTGRGRKPNWVLAQLKAGANLEDFAI